MRGTNNIDVIVGGNVRRIRLIKHVSQVSLGEAIGVTFQQVQKYELASNRISASKLYEIAQFFEVPVSAFYAGTNDPPSGSFDLIREFDPEIYALGEAVSAVPSSNVRRRVMALVESISGQRDDEASDI